MIPVEKEGSSAESVDEAVEADDLSAGFDVGMARRSWRDGIDDVEASAYVRFWVGKYDA